MVLNIDQAGLRQRILDMASGMDPEDLSGLLGDMRGLLQSRGLEPSCARAREPRPGRLFFVPEGVRHLDSAQLEALTRAVDEWAAQARSPLIRFSRQRMRMIYLMLRHSGAKVGEVLALDDRRDLDLEAGEVLVRGEAPGDPERRVPLPREFLDELRRFLAQPRARQARGQIFRMDQGFVRRKLAEQAERVPFPRELLNPTVLRHSRAVELLRQGAPLPVVQALLGHASLVMTSGYCAFSEEDTRRILNHYIQRGDGMKTSARNTFSGFVSEVRAGELLTEVVLRTASGLEVVSLITGASAANLGVAKGRPMSAIVKAPFVLLSRDGESARLSARNSYPARITGVRGDGLCHEVSGVLEDGTPLCALVAGDSASAPSLAGGDPVWFSFKAMSVILVAQ